MPHFTYIARTVDGRIERGSINAASLDDARERLRKQALLVEELHASAGMLSAKPETVQPKPVWTVTEPVVPAKAAVAAPAQPAVATIQATAMAQHGEDIHYAPLSDTLRLFAGWLMAWYGIVYLFGSYQAQGKLPVSWTFLENMFTSPLILRFAFATYVFLLCGSLHRWLGGGIGKGILVTLLGLIMFAFFHTGV